MVSSCHRGKKELTEVILTRSQVMEPLHRKLLQKNRTKLIDNISNPIDVVEKLFEKNLFTEAMKQEVEVCKKFSDFYWLKAFGLMEF